TSLDEGLFTQFFVLIYLKVDQSRANPRDPQDEKRDDQHESSEGHLSEIGPFFASCSNGHKSYLTELCN
ncbi:MAG TPA: hypothetical protein DDW24_05640, partial [Blastocatellia bacterium]|nr:hypothetical protein [Blastocatellia bacterium]